MALSILVRFPVSIAESDSVVAVTLNIHFLCRFDSASKKTSSLNPLYCPISVLAFGKKALLQADFYQNSSGFFLSA